MAAKRLSGKTSAAPLAAVAAEATLPAVVAAVAAEATPSADVVEDAAATGVGTAAAASGGRSADVHVAGVARVVATAGSVGDGATGVGAPAVAGSGCPGAVASAVAVGGSAADAQDAMIKQAAALRAKYRRPNKIRIPVEQLGFHPCNRDGQPPNGQRCMELFIRILNNGYDVEEADAGGVAVAVKPGCRQIEAFNIEACDGDPLHVPVITGCIAFGSLSHSHLHQILKNIKGRGKVEGCPAVADSDGRFSLDKLRQADDQFATAVESGLLWEVLNCAIEDEEPFGCSIIQAALNAKNGLMMLRHEMQALSAVCRTTALVRAGRLSVEWVRSQLALTLPEFASDESFMDLFRFCIDLGGEDAAFLGDLRQFHEKFVNPELRRVKLSVFAVANAIPLGCPHVRVAALKWVYTQGKDKIRNGFIEALPLRVGRAIASPSMKPATEVAEVALRFCHVQCAPALSQLTVHAKVKLLGNIDTAVFGVLERMCSETDATTVREKYPWRRVIV